MPQATYPWKRFWYPRSADFRISDGGYLSDPDGEHGRILNPDAVSFDDIRGKPCLVLLGEPGVGKSTVIRESDATLKFDLGAYQSDSSIAQEIFLHPQVQAWSLGTGCLTLSLDSLDEGRLAISNLVKVLLRELHKFKDGVPRLALRIGCRTADWPVTLEDGLKELWGQASVAVYQLAPLRRKDVTIAAESNGLVAADFLREVQDREAVAFAIKPLTLTFLLNCFKRDKRFPATRAALYREGCRGLCEETEERRDAGWVGNLSADARLTVAARIGALTILGGFSAVWNGADRGDVPDSDISIRRIAGGTERRNDIPVTVDEHAVTEVLGTGLFSSSGVHRLGWSHHTYAEFLAALYLVERNFTTTQTISLLSLPDDKEGRLAPQLHETAAWVASMRPELFRRIMEADPSVLLLSDVATADAADRGKLVETLLKLYDEERLLDSNWGLRSLYKKLSHPTLEQQLLPYIVDPKKRLVVRRVAIDIAEACQLQSLQGDLINVALDRNQDVQVRVQAAYALTRIGDLEAKAKLKSLAVEAHSEDTQDELKGCALEATWPHAITPEEIFNSLTAPKDRAFGGAYSGFLVSTLLKGLQRGHLPAALSWLTRQRTRRDLPIEFEKLSDAIMALAWDNLDAPGVLEPFVRVVITRLHSHDEILGESREISHQMFISDAGKRRLLVERLVEYLPVSDVRFLPWLIAGVGRGEDFLWLLSSLTACSDGDLKAKWVTLLTHVFNPSDQVQLEAVLAGASSAPIIASAFSQFINPVAIGSPEANQQRAAYEENQRLEQEMRKMTTRVSLSPPPSERIAVRLRQFEDGKMGAWWQLHMEMTLKENSTHYGEEWEGDLTVLPGWENSSPEIRERIIAAARRYLVEGDPHTEQWLGKDVWHRPAMAGYRALLLLLRERRKWLEELDDAIWNKWAATSLAYPTTGTYNHSPLKGELFQMAYKRARQELISALGVVIDHENTRSEYLAVMDKLSGCWDTELAESLYLKCQDEKLKASFVGVLLDFLLERGHSPAYSLAVSLIPPRADGRARDLAVVGAAGLLRNASDGGWQSVWSAIQEDRQFGKDVFASLERRIDLDGWLVARHLTEEQLADLYLWLTETYPEPQQSTESGWLGTSDLVSGWRNGILKYLQACGTEKACEAIGRLMHELPGQTFLKWALQGAREMTRHRNWRPAEPEHILAMASDSSKRLVRGGEELLGVVIEALEKLISKLRGETPLVANLWNEVADGVWEPKDEEHFSDNVKQHLDDELRVKGVVLNREVVIRRNRGKVKGERTDIHVDAVIPGAKAEDLDVVTVVVEAKGCWNKDLWTAMKSQLADRYLHESRSRHGLYLVGWFNCPQWSPQSSKKAAHGTLQEAQARLAKQATELSQGTLLIEACVLDTSLR